MAAEVSVIIPNLHSPIVDRTIRSVESQATDNFEIIVVGLDRHGLINTNNHITFVSTGRSVYPSVARNIGLDRAVGQYVIFLDADCVAAPGWLDALLFHLRQEPCAVSGSMHLTKDNFWILCDNIATFHEYLSNLPRGTRPYLPSFSLAIHREALLAVGGFDESLPTAEDLDLSIRIASAGYKLYFEPTAVVYHYPERRSAISVFAHSSVSGQNSMRVRLKYGPIFRMPSIVQNPLGLLALSPVVAAYVTLKIFLGDPHLWIYWYTSPIIFLSKIAWCLSASRALADRQAMQSRR
ncbi:MAG: glycosyltransferase [Chloroflexi bacterium]|nr:glycosyltransferase [Chloroflexota bacterium]MCL5075620.1 glycosyltransferase [Chloroflexota bacterium]